MKEFASKYGIKASVMASSLIESLQTEQEGFRVVEGNLYAAAMGFVNLEEFYEAMNFCRETGFLKPSSEKNVWIYTGKKLSK